MSLYISRILEFGSTLNTQNAHQRIPAMEHANGRNYYFTLTNLLIYQGFLAKVNKLKTNKEYIVSKRVTRAVSRI